MDANLEVACGCEAHSRALSHTTIGSTPQVLMSELEAYSAQLRTYRGTVAAILERSRGTLDLVKTSPQSIKVVITELDLTVASTTAFQNPGFS